MDLNKVRQELLEEKNRLEREREAIADADSEQSLSDDSGEMSSYDNHPADSGSATFAREIDQAFIERLERLTQKVERAIEKIDKGTYGTCDRCSQPISKPRLQAMPSAALCLECQDKEDAL